MIDEGSEVAHGPSLYALCQKYGVHLPSNQEFTALGQDPTREKMRIRNILLAMYQRDQACAG